MLAKFRRSSTSVQRRATAHRLHALPLLSARRDDNDSTEDACPSRRSAMVGMSALLAFSSGVQPGFAVCSSSSQRLSIEEVETRLRQCFVEGQYYVSGALDREIFDADCVFTDPTIRVKGTEKYASAVAEIFSPATSRADLISLQQTGPNKLEVDWRLEGVITQGGTEFKFKPYVGHTVYTLDDCTGKIVRQDETWGISRIDVFVSLFFPSFGAPPAPPAEDLRRARNP